MAKFEDARTSEHAFEQTAVADAAEIDEYRSVGDEVMIGRARIRLLNAARTEWRALPCPTDLIAPDNGLLFVISSFMDKMAR